MRAITLAAVLFAAVAVQAQEKPFSQQVNVTAIELSAQVTDAQGKAPTDLKPSDFVIIEDGVERPVVALEYLGVQSLSMDASSKPAIQPKAWNIVVYVDLELSNMLTTRDALRSLVGQAERLTSLGTVEIVIADPAPVRFLAPTRDAKAVAEALTAALAKPAKNRVGRMRKDFLDRYNSNRIMNANETGAVDVRGAVEEEHMLLRTHLERLALWMGTYPRTTPNALFLVSDGFDLNPADFYTELMAGGGADVSWNENSPAGSGAPPVNDNAAVAPGSRPNMPTTNPGMSGRQSANTLRAESSDKTIKYHASVAQAAAAGGWTITTLSGGVAGDFSDDAGTEGKHRTKKFISGSGASGRAGALTSTNPRDTLHGFADATGGSVENNPANFATVIDTLGNRVRLTYQVPRPVDAVVRKVEVRSKRPGMKVRATQFTASSTSELTASARANTLLEAPATVGATGELPLVAKLEIEEVDRNTRTGRISARMSVQPIEAMRKQLNDTTVRVTVAVEQEKQRPSITHILLRRYDLSSRNEVVFTSPIQIPKAMKGIAVTMEELTTGSWGGTSIPLSSAAKNQNTFASAGWTEPAPGVEATGPALAWLSWDEALKQAQSSRKLIFAWAPDVKCDRCARYERDIIADASFRTSLDDFVPLRIDAASAAKARMTKAFAVLDPWGNARYSWTDVDAPGLVTRMGQARDLGKQILRAGDLLSKGETAEGHFALGFMYLNSGVNDEAKKEYESARDAATAAGNAALAQRAEIQMAVILAKTNKPKDAIKGIDKILKTPVDASNEAEAWLIKGHLLKALGDANGANEAYKRAAAKAPKGSPLGKAAESLARF